MSRGLSRKPSPSTNLCRAPFLTTVSATETTSDLPLRNGLTFATMGAGSAAFAAHRDTAAPNSGFGRELSHSAQQKRRQSESGGCAPCIHSATTGRQEDSKTIVSSRRPLGEPRIAYKHGHTHTLSLVSAMRPTCYPLLRSSRRAYANRSHQLGAGRHSWAVASAKAARRRLRHNHVQGAAHEGRGKLNRVAAGPPGRHARPSKAALRKAPAPRIGGKRPRAGRQSPQRL